MVDPTIVPKLTLKVEETLWTNAFEEYFCKRFENEDFPVLMRRAKQYISRNFFKLAGICNDIVVEGEPMLNYECWFKICSYLKLNDLIFT